jgi:hypothetical protein
MAFLRTESQFLRQSLTASATIDTSTYDRAGRFTTDAKAALAGADETPQFIFMEDASADEPVSVAFIGMGQVQLALSGTGSKGDKLSIGANGVFTQSGTSASAEMDEDDIGVALEDWTDGALTEVMIYRGAKL